MNIILASASPRRKALMKKAGFRFRVEASDVSEECFIAHPARRVEALALRKAKAVAARCKEGLVIGADTLVILGSTILGKPESPEAAYKMLYRLSGSLHKVMTGVAIVNVMTGEEWVDSAQSSVRMKKLPLGKLLALSRRHLDKAGAYAIQEKNDPIAKVVKGSYENVVGLPIDLVKKMLAKAGQKRDNLRSKV